MYKLFKIIIRVNNSKRKCTFKRLITQIVQDVRLIISRAIGGLAARRKSASSNWQRCIANLIWEWKNNVWLIYGLIILQKVYRPVEVVSFPSFTDDHDASDRFLIITDTCKTTLIGCSNNTLVSTKWKVDRKFMWASALTNNKLHSTKK